MLSWHKTGNFFPKLIVVIFLLMSILFSAIVTNSQPLFAQVDSTDCHSIHSAAIQRAHDARNAVFSSAHDARNAALSSAHEAESAAMKAAGNLDTVQAYHAARIAAKQVYWAAVQNAKAAYSAAVQNAKAAYSAALTSADNAFAICLDAKKTSPQPATPETDIEYDDPQQMCEDWGSGVTDCGEKSNKGSSPINCETVPSMCYRCDPADINCALKDVNTAADLPNPIAPSVPFESYCKENPISCWYDKHVGEYVEHFVPDFWWTAITEGIGELAPGFPAGPIGLAGSVILGEKHQEYFDESGGGLISVGHNPSKYPNCHLVPLVGIKCF